ncbi:hypothetical protein BJ684DRAFT_19238 [Piptocephalis cylindrospora]|uniref:Uncharacterized protein n=1 Tax=Piptocephalis cylindrospora TaxID=1907219 RepID=A0A4V1IYF2_9FUNG|nr:hypothetical protein BJ684DRAFT_19238 [Piptocephalis cylindrospora]|eukprot:RKP14349.1 hypothetical protein BJ684DRAFT_19238 [Piptocephalis cylindrospora]
MPYLTLLIIHAVLVLLILTPLQRASPASIPSSVSSSSQQPLPTEQPSTSEKEGVQPLDQPQPDDERLKPGHFIKTVEQMQLEALLTPRPIINNTNTSHPSPSSDDTPPPALTEEYVQTLARLFNIHLRPDLPVPASNPINNSPIAEWSPAFSQMGTGYFV